MNIRSVNLSAVVLAFAAFCFAGSASAVPLLCETASPKQTYLSDVRLPSCASAGVSVDGSLWQSSREIVVNLTPADAQNRNNWLVHYLNPLLFTGDWRYEKVRDNTGRVAQIKLYGPKNVPEPGALALFGVGLLCAGIARRRAK